MGFLSKLYTLFGGHRSLNFLESSHSLMGLFYRLVKWVHHADLDSKSFTK